MPRPADPAIRSRFIDVAARKLVDGEAVSLRRIAAEVGTSTMAVYTYFGGVDELMREVRREGFRRLAHHLASVTETRDPVADLIALGWAYSLNGVENPYLYRAMFFETTADLDDAAFGASTFLPVIDAVQRAIDAGRLHVDAPWDPAVQMWAMAHGALSLALGGMLGVAELLHHMEGGVSACLIGFGDHPRAVRRSVTSARRRMTPSGGLPTLPPRGATLADAAAAAHNRQSPRQDATEAGST
jgi:AcrR family transcriptional regulator